MPFQSEKQRRFLWLKHPDLAKRWAHEYPNQKKLPMYAHENKAHSEQTEADKKPQAKEAGMAGSLEAFSPVLAGVLRRGLAKYGAYVGISKKSNSILQYVEVPHSGKPVAAGDEPVKPKQEIGCDTGSKADGAPQRDLLALFSKQEKPEQPDEPGLKAAAKLAAVLAPALRPGTPQNAGLDVAKLRQKIHEQKTTQLFGGNPLPLAEQQKRQAQPAQKPAQQPAQQQPSVTSSQLTNTNLMGNKIGTLGPMNSKNGVPTQQQNVTGNASFGGARQAPGATQFGIT